MPSRLAAAFPPVDSANLTASVLNSSVYRRFGTDLLLLDDFSYVRRDQTETTVLFQLIAERYERKSIALTANQPFSEWNQVFPDRP